MSGNINTASYVETYNSPYTSVSSILQTQHITIVVRLAGERFEGEEIASEAHDKVSVDITKVINEVGDQNIKPCLYSFLGQTHGDE